MSPESEVLNETTKPQPTTIQHQPQTLQQLTQPTFNWENIKPKPMEFDFDINSLNFPKIRVSSERKRTRTRKQPTRSIQITEVPQVAKEPSKKDTKLFIADIEEYSSINLFLDDVDEVFAIGPTTWLPE